MLALNIGFLPLGELVKKYLRRVRGDKATDIDLNQKVIGFRTLHRLNLSVDRDVLVQLDVADVPAATRKTIRK